MYRKLPFIILLLVFTACHKNQPQQAHCPDMPCTKIFASVSIHFTDKLGNSVAAQNFQVLNLRTNQRIYAASAANVNLATGYFIVADDANLGDLSLEGDNVKVTASNPATSQVKTAILKLSGGCSCHITKLSGPQEVAFD
ncbi:hypothetical protein BH09BAC6_BH09BAC6_04220 [soil metagenome]|jgi:hypothetical protein